MNKSIEIIWKEGFLNDEPLIQPKVNDLYNKKSEHVIDKMLRIGRLNLILIMAGALFLLVGSFLIDAGIAGTIIFLLLSWLVWYGKKRGDKVALIDKGKSCYHYLRSFKNWMNETISGYTLIYRVFYPAFFITFFVGMWFSVWGQIMSEKLLTKYPDMLLIMDMPVYFVIVLSLIASFSSIFAGAIYRLDLKPVYGEVMHKLDELVADMEHLRNE